MMTKKTLAKAVTLSVLLMMPYGMAWAAEYDTYIHVGGNSDNYQNVENAKGEKIKTVDGNTYIYDFGGEADLNIKTSKSQINNDCNRGIGIINRNSKVIIKDRLNVTVSKGYDKPLSKNISVFGILINNAGSLLDRRFGGDIVVNEGTQGISISGSKNIIYGGSGNIAVTGRYNGFETNSEATYGIDIGNAGGGSAIYWGEGNITVSDNTTKYDQSRKKSENTYVNAINLTSDKFSVSYNRDVVLGIKNSDDYDNVDKYKNIKSDEYSTLVNELGTVTLNATAENISETVQSTVKANGIEFNNSNGNVIGGSIIINSTAVNNGNYKEGEKTEANGIISNLGNTIFNNATITATASSSNGMSVSANGINLYGSKSYPMSYLNDDSTINATATGSGNVL